MNSIYHSLAYITLIFLGILMCFYIGLRDVSIGSDTDNYIFAFESGNFISVSDPFYTLLNELFRNLNASHTVLFLFISIHIRLRRSRNVCLPYRIINEEQKL